MEIVQETLGAVQVLAPSGRLDTDSSADFELAVQDLLGADARHFVVDLANISYVSSAGLRVLLMLGKSVDGKGSLRVAGLNPQVKQVFDIAGFTKLFAMYADREAALAGHPQADAPAAPRAPTPVPPSREPAKAAEPPRAAAAPAPRPASPSVAEPGDVRQIDKPRADAPQVDAPHVDAPRVDLPRVEPVVAPRVEVPNIEAPRIAEPVLDAPVLAPPPPAAKPRDHGVADFAATIIGAGTAPSDPVDAHAQDTARRAAQLLAANELPGAPKPAARAKAASERPVAPERAAVPPRPVAPPPPAPPAAAAASTEKKPGFLARLFGKK